VIWITVWHQSSWISSGARGLLQNFLFTTSVSIDHLPFFIFTVSDLSNMCIDCIVNEWIRVEQSPDSKVLSNWVSLIIFGLISIEKAQCWSARKADEVLLNCYWFERPIVDYCPHQAVSVLLHQDGEWSASAAEWYHRVVLSQYLRVADHRLCRLSADSCCRCRH